MIKHPNLKRVLMTGMWLAGFMLLWVSAASAQTVSFDVLLDLDRNSSSGCAATPIGQPPFGGFEHRVQAVVDNTTQIVTEVNVANCVAGAFATPVVTGGPHAVGLNNGVSGTDVVELSAALTDLGSPAGNVIAFAVVTDDGNGADVVVTDDGTTGGGQILFGLPAEVPAIGLFGLLLLGGLLLLIGFFARRGHSRWLTFGLVGMAGIVLAANFIVDGNVPDWAGEVPRAIDPAGDPSNGGVANDVQAFFIGLENETLFFRVDVTDLENIAPDAVDDAFSTDEDVALNVPVPGVLGNDTDVNMDPITAVLVTAPANAQSFNLNADGSFNYTPTADFNGTDIFTYVANDGIGDSAPATVTITVNPVNDAPVATGEMFTTDEDTQLDVSAPGVLSNDTDVDMDALSAVLVTGPANAQSFTLNADGSFSYNPNADFNGTDSFTYQADDGSTTSNTVTVDLTVNAVNDAPVAMDDPFSTDEDVALNVPADGVLGNDTDVEMDPLTAILVSGPANAQSFTFNANGSFDYTPVADFNGSDSFTYMANDGSDDSNIATVNITVNPVNDAPVAIDDMFSTDEDNQLDVMVSGVLMNDTDVDIDMLTTVLISGPSDAQSFMLNSDGSFSYNPNANFNGSDSFTYQADDGTTTSGTATVNITINPVNDLPVAMDDAFMLAEDTTLNTAPTSVLDDDTDVEMDPLTAILITGPANALSFMLNSNGTFSYTPLLNFNGSDSFTYEANDGSGNSNTALVMLTINPVPDPPVAMDDMGLTDEDSLVQIDVTMNDTDPDGDMLTVIVLGGSPVGSTMINGNNVDYDPNGQFESLAAGATAMDSFTYTIQDATGNMMAATVNVTITGVNDDPVADLPGPLTTYVEGDPPVIIDATATASDIDSADLNGGVLTVQLTNNSTIDDRLAINNEVPPNPAGTGLEISGANILFNGAAIGSFSGGTDGFTPLVVNFASVAATPTAVRAVLRNLTFEDQATPATTNLRSLSLQLTDGDGGTSALVTQDINVEPPVICDGTVFANFCWFIGNNDESCDTVCADHGGNNALGTTDFAGSGGTSANCTNVLDALGQTQPGCVGAEERTGEAIGCGVDQQTSNSCPTGGSTRNYVRYISPITTAGAASGVGLAVRRACACNDQPAPISISYAGAPFSLPRGVAVNLPPTVSGFVVAYSITPALPAGLNFNTSTGVITGIPSSTSAATSYMVTASNAGGMVNTSFMLTVVAQPPANLAYPGAPFLFNLNNAIPPAMPTFTGQVDSFMVSPALPSGLMFNTITGEINGTPTAIQAATNHTVTATNIDGSDMVIISVEVTNAIACDGVALDGFCWYLGQNDESCDAVCSGRGGNNPAGTTAYVGSGGTSPQCESVMNALGQTQPGCTGIEERTGLAVGCGTDFQTSNSCPTGGSSRNFIRYTSPATTGSAASGAGLSIRRACACNAQPAPLNVSYANAPFSFTQGIPIAAQTPTVTNAVTSWSINPALPAGLSFSTTTGVISGNPTGLQAATNHTVTATNAGGSAMVIISIAVSAAPPMNLDYPAAPFVFNVGNPINPAQLPTVTGAVDSYMISPALPTGITFSATTGAIAGTPTVVSAATNYTVTATNTAGNDTVMISITVNGAASCAGTLVGGFCWYFGANNQSCDTVCATNGGYNNGTETFAGSGGSGANCTAVLDALGQSQPGCTGAEARTGLAVGCGMDFETANSCPTGGSTRNYVRYTSPTTTGSGSSASSSLFIRRACACNN